MIVGTGIDLSEISRIEELMTHPQFVEKILTEQEREQLAQLTGKRRNEYVAGRYSVKESFSKALGTGVGAHFSFHNLSVLDDSLGKPVGASDIFDGQIHVSISHTDSLVISQVVLEKE